MADALRKLLKRHEVVAPSLSNGSDENLSPVKKLAASPCGSSDSPIPMYFQLPKHVVTDEFFVPIEKIVLTEVSSLFGPADGDQLRCKTEPLDSNHGTPPTDPIVSEEEEKLHRCEICDDKVDVGSYDGELASKLVEHATIHADKPFEQRCSECSFKDAHRMEVVCHITTAHDRGLSLSIIPDDRREELQQLTRQCFPQHEEAVNSAVLETVASMFSSRPRTSTQATNKARRSAPGVQSRHVSKNYQSEKCRKCSMLHQDVTPSGLSSHVWSHAKFARYICKICGWHSYTRSHLAKHLDSTHPNEPHVIEDSIDAKMVEDIMAEATVCYPKNAKMLKKWMAEKLQPLVGGGTADNAAMPQAASRKRQHPQSSTANGALAYPMTDVPTPKVPASQAVANQCLLCGSSSSIMQSVYQNARKLVNHARTHLSARPFCCSECGHESKIKNTVSAHIKAMHAGKGDVVDKSTPEFIAQLKECCRRLYPLQVDVCEHHLDITHMNLKSDGLTLAAEAVPRVKDWTCKICHHRLHIDAPSRVVKGLVEHSMRHITWHKAYKCSVCLHACHTEDNLSNHIRVVHHGNGHQLKSFTPDYCAELRLQTLNGFAITPALVDAQLEKLQDIKDGLCTSAPQPRSATLNKAATGSANSTSGTSGMNGPRVCKECGFKSNVGSDKLMSRSIVNHTLTHITYCPFRCAVCAYPAKNRSSFYRRVNVDHKCGDNIVLETTAEFYDELMSKCMNNFSLSKEVLRGWLNRFEPRNSTDWNLPLNNQQLNYYIDDDTDPQQPSTSALWPSSSSANDTSHEPVPFSDLFHVFNDLPANAPTEHKLVKQEPVTSEVGSSAATSASFRGHGNQQSANDVAILRNQLAQTEARAAAEIAELKAMLEVKEQENRMLRTELAEANSTQTRIELQRKEEELEEMRHKQRAVYLHVGELSTECKMLKDEVELLKNKNKPSIVTIDID
ncbi:unnamed protein product, partial [Mesorhabditis spiculigera]